MVFFTLLFTASLILAQNPLPSVVDQYVEDFRNDFDIRDPNRNNYRPLLANVVRLAFHYCVGDGGCDGCINLSQPDNAGLELSVDYLDGKVDAWMNAGLSKADLYALASMVAANMALGNAGWESDLSNFEIGRTDCDDANDEDVFPDAHQSPFQFFEENFGFTARETTVIFGAHTLGRAQVGNSGFQNFWVNNPLELGNDFFQRVEDNPWRQESVGDLFQWDQNGLMALNADMFLVRDLNIAANGRELNCANNFNQCPDAATLNIVESFTTNQGEAQFQAEFKEVYTQMLRSAGQGFEQELQLVCDVYDCNAQPAETSSTPIQNDPETVEDSADDETVEDDSEDQNVEDSADDENIDDNANDDNGDDNVEGSSSSSDSSEDENAEDDKEDIVVQTAAPTQNIPPPPTGGKGRGKGKGRGGKGRGRLQSVRTLEEVVIKTEWSGKLAPQGHKLFGIKFFILKK